ncbi:MAG: hypothetical protein PUE12_06935 [Oscillospiraceae bacterium]|nr:hypothetical protein [Oscillospiraceae bacterium]
MWKTIYSIDLNLLIGIIGGIISGIFVSYVFLIEAEFRNQFNHVKEMFTSIYGITATYSAYEHFKITKGKKRANKVKAIDNAGNIAGKSNIVDILNNYWNELSSFFITYEPWQYKFRLNKILMEINDIVTDGKYMIRNSPEDFAEISQRLETCIALFKECEQNYKKEILIRVVTSKSVQIFLLLFISLIIVLLIAA